jgi:hypothetical protein
LETVLRDYLKQGRPIRAKFESYSSESVKFRGIQSAVDGAYARRFGAVLLTDTPLPGRFNQVVSDPSQIVEDTVLDVVNQVTPALAVKLARIEALNRKDQLKALPLIEKLKQELSKIGVNIQVTDSGITASWNLGILIAHLEAQVEAKQRALVSA